MTARLFDLGPAGADPAPAVDTSVSISSSSIMDAAHWAALREWYLVPVPIPWRCVRARDAVRGDEGEHETAAIWTIIRSGWARPIDPPPGTPPDAKVWQVIAQCGIERVPFTVDPDMMADVLIEVAQADAMALTREQLGARLLATRTDPDGGFSGDLDWRGESTPL